MIIKILFLILFTLSCASKNSTSTSTVLLSEDLSKEDIFFETEELKEIISSKSNTLILRDSLYLSYGYLQLLKEIEKNNTSIDYYACYGHACLVLAIYIKEKNLGKAEWKLYNLWREIKKEMPYSVGWEKKITTFIENEFKDQRLNGDKYYFYTWNTEAKKLYTISTGPLVTVLKNCIFLKTAYKWKNAILSETGILFNEVQQTNILDSQFLAPPNAFKKLSGDLIGVYGKYFTQLKNYDHINSLFLEKSSYDEDENFSLIQNEAKLEIKNNEKIKAFIQKEKN